MPILYPASNRFKYARSASDFRARRYAIQNPPPPFDPSVLFAAMEQGAWYDPSDLTTLYQDAAGTTPVTAVEQPVGLMLDKSGRGNHAFQTTATSRPVLSARVNLLTKTESFDDAAWTKTRCAVTANATTAPDGTLTGDLLAETTATGQHLLRRTNAPTLTAGTTYAYSVFAKAGNRNLALYLFRDSFFAQATFNLSTGTVHSNDSGTASIQSVGNGWYRCSVVGTVSAGASAGSFVDISILDGSFNVAYTGDGTSGIYIWGASLVPANQASLPYQRVNTATDYDSDPAKFAKADSFDGVDDSLIAASGGGSTTKFFWCGAIQCKKVGAAQTLFSDTGTNTGYRVRINASNQLELSAGNGTAFTTVATAGTLAIDQRAVLTAWHDGASLKVQIDNGTVATAAFATATAGTAQFTMGKDNNAASSFFGGWIYEKVYLKDDVPTDTEITSTKQYMAEAAGVTL